MALSAIPYIHSDAGGFAGGDGDAELYIRWLQFAVFTPIYRPHGTALGDLEPTVKEIPSEAALWPEPTLSLARSAAKERYQWLPYNYNLSYLQTLSGKPLIKPLFFLNETDSNLYKAEDQYLWGDKVMIVPITNKSEKIKTYFIPEGKWTNIYDYRVFEGPKWVTDSNITINQIPVYAMEGSFIPQATGITTTADYDKASFSVLFFPSAKPGEYHWYEDDGTDPAAIKNKNYRITHFSATPKYNGTEIVITREGNYNINVPREIMLVIPAQGIPKGVRMNNKLIKTDRLFAGNFLRIPVLLNKASTEIFISW
jgi:oligosaccharide 4-alpha-D-glucosyltransferase